MRECGACQACCQGWVQGDAYGCKFGKGKQCLFLLDKCSIYHFRPQTCQKFYCGWAQELVPEWMRPDQCKVLISIENWSGGQFLRCMEMGQKMSDDALLEITKFCQQNNAPYMLQYEGEWKIYGPEPFIQEMVNTSR